MLRKSDFLECQFKVFLWNRKVWISYCLQIVIETPKAQDTIFFSLLGLLAYTGLSLLFESHGAAFKLLFLRAGLLCFCILGLAQRFFLSHPLLIFFSFRYHFWIKCLSNVSLYLSIIHSLCLEYPYLYLFYFPNYYQFFHPP